MKKESSFQKALIKELKELFPGCIVLKNDAGYIQGFPDLLILFKKMWAALECKRDEFSSHQPNQDFYVNELSQMSFAKFIWPGNKQEVLDELQQTFRSGRKTRISKRK